MADRSSQKELFRSKHTRVLFLLFCIGLRVLVNPSPLLRGAEKSDPSRSDPNRSIEGTSASESGKPGKHTSPSVDDAKQERKKEDSEPVSYAVREWADASGTYRVRAAFVDMSTDAVDLRREDGTVVTVPKERLSRGDLDYLKDYVVPRLRGLKNASNGPEDRPLGAEKTRDPGVAVAILAAAAVRADPDIRRDDPYWGKLTCGYEWAEWEPEIPAAGKWYVYVLMASDESRPGNFVINGELQRGAVLGGKTGGFHLRNAKWIKCGPYEFKVGKNLFRHQIIRPKGLPKGHGPHIRGFVFSQSANLTLSGEAPFVTPVDGASKPVAEVASAPEPAFEIVHTITKRADGAPTLYVLVNKELDLTTAQFKEVVRSIIAEICKTSGDKLTIEIHDNRESLDISYKLYGDFSLKRVLTDEEQRIRERHAIALFAGHLELGVLPHELDYFPYAIRTSPLVGQYAGSEEFDASK